MILWLPDGLILHQPACKFRYNTSSRERKPSPAENPMTKLVERIKTFHFPEYTIPLALLAVTGLAYGVLIPWLGFYWDDWAGWKQRHL